MPSFERATDHGAVSIHYEEFGAGFPILLFAPGGMRSSIEFWAKSPFDPTIEFAKDFRVIAMDQRNAGKSKAPLSRSDGWHTYTQDHIALLDHLGLKQCHLLGGCIGGSYSFGMIKAAPDRVAAAVLQNPIGLSPVNRELFFAMFDGWGRALKPSHPEIDDAG
ncbi:MAG: alpha/beta fold hydrolase, partial [Pseudomonadota bacterium]